MTLGLSVVQEWPGMAKVGDEGRDRRFFFFLVVFGGGEDRGILSVLWERTQSVYPIILVLYQLEYHYIIPLIGS